MLDRIAENLNPILNSQAILDMAQAPENLGPLALVAVMIVRLRDGVHTDMLEMVKYLPIKKLNLWRVLTLI
jgi:hypothetical protein